MQAGSAFGRLLGRPPCRLLGRIQVGIVDGQRGAPRQFLNRDQIIRTIVAAVRCRHTREHANRATMGDEGHGHKGGGVQRPQKLEMAGVAGLGHMHSIGHHGHERGAARAQRPRERAGRVVRISGVRAEEFADQCVLLWVHVNQRYLVRCPIGPHRVDHARVGQDGSNQSGQALQCRLVVQRGGQHRGGGSQEALCVLVLSGLSDIDGRANVSGKVARGHKAGHTGIQHPAIRAISMVQTVLHCEGAARLEGRLIRVETAPDIVGMYSLCPPIAHLLLQGTAREVQPGLVEKRAQPVRPRHP